VRITDAGGADLPGTRFPMKPISATQDANGRDYQLLAKLPSASSAARSSRRTPRGARRRRTCGRPRSSCGRRLGDGRSHAAHAIRITGPKKDGPGEDFFLPPFFRHSSWVDRFDKVQDQWSGCRDEQARDPCLLEFLKNTGFYNVETGGRLRP
jgi:hypothetical protein